MSSKKVKPESSPFGYKLVDRTPKPGVIAGVVIGLFLFMALFYFIGSGNVH
jgi:hypothetical protein